MRTLPEEKVNRFFRSAPLTRDFSLVSFFSFFSFFSQRQSAGKVAAFTLVEMMAVVSIMVIMCGLAIPAFSSLKKSGDITKSVYDISGTLDQARAYAMGNNTYVYVGMQEVDVLKDESAKPASGVGRLVVAVVASKDGTTPAVGTKLDAANLTALQKVQRFENLHLADFYDKTAANGPMHERDGKLSAKAYSMGYDTTTKVFFEWPLTGTGQYKFAKVIQFSPQGIATVCDVIGTPKYLEIGLMQTNGNNGNAAPAVPNDLGTTNLAAIQVDGVLGTNRIYRP